MRYKPERALTQENVIALITFLIVEMRYKPERALTQVLICPYLLHKIVVEMRYKPERALTHTLFSPFAPRIHR